MIIAAAGLALLLRIDPTHRDYLADVLPGMLVFALCVLAAPLFLLVVAVG